MAYGDLLCSKCKKSKPKNDFFKESKFTRGYRYACKDCEKPMRKIYKSKIENKLRATETRRRWSRKNKYNFPQELYDQRFEEQGSCCAICKTTVAGGKGTFHADHDHKTNQPRGVLCHNCNIALGNFKDNPEILKTALLYLEGWNNAIWK